MLTKRRRRATGLLLLISRHDAQPFHGGQEFPPIATHCRAALGLGRFDSVGKLAIETWTFGYPLFVGHNCALFSAMFMCRSYDSTAIVTIQQKKGFIVEYCVICGVEPAFGKGEHVWPAWFLKDADAADPPSFAWSSNGVDLLGRSGEPLHFRERQRLLVPACRSCNAVLDTRFEKPAKDVVRRLVPNRWTGEADEQEWVSIGLWFAKILLLATHPLAHHQHPEINRHMIIGDWQSHDFRWLVNGSAPPTDLSLWVYRAEQNKGDPTARVLLPKAVQTGDGTTTIFPMTMITLDGISLTLVYHPGWAIEHPLISRREALELLHGARTADLEGMPLLPQNAIVWRRPNLVELMDGLQLDGTLPPLGVITDLPVPHNLLDSIKLLMA